MKKINKWKITTFFRNTENKMQEKILRFHERSGQNMESDEMLDLSVKLRMHKAAVRMKYMIIGIAAIILVAGVLLYKQFRVLHNYSVLSSVERSDDAVTQYVRVKKNRTLKCNPNGVTCVNDANEVQWNTTFNMQSLIVDSCESTVAVGDQRGSLVYVFNEDGLMGSFEVEHNLMKLCVSRQGVVAAVLEAGETTLINVYDKNGNLIVKNKTSMAESGYPLDVALSQDGYKMAVSYLGVDQKNIRTRVAFYNFSSVGQGQTDNLVNSVEYEGKVVPEVRFMGSGHAVAILDDGLAFFRGRQMPEEFVRVKEEQELISVFADDDYVGIVTASDEEDQKHKFKMSVYRSNGHKMMTKYFDLDYTEIRISDGEVILYNNSDMEIYTVSGKKKFSGSYEKRIQDVMRSGSSKKYTIVTPDSTDLIKIR